MLSFSCPDEGNCTLEEKIHANFQVCHGGGGGGMDNDRIDSCISDLISQKTRQRPWG